MKEPPRRTAPLPPPKRTRSILGDVWAFFIHRPARKTLVGMESKLERRGYSDRIARRLDVDVSKYSVLNLHRIGIQAPVDFVFQELMEWGPGAAFWPNQIATAERVDGRIEKIRVHAFGLGRRHPKDRWWSRPLFDLNALRIQAVPSQPDVDNARYFLYECGGGYPIGIFAIYLRSAITEQGERERTQLFFGVGFDFYGKRQGPLLRPMNWIWERVHNRVTANVLNRLKQLCEAKFQASEIEGCDAFSEES